MVGASGIKIMNDTVTIEEEFLRKRHLKMNITYADPSSGFEWVFLLLMVGLFFAVLYNIWKNHR